MIDARQFVDSDQKTTRRLTAARQAPAVERAQIENDVVSRHLGLARGLAHRFAGRGPEQDDLEQVAYLGLVKAVRRYEPGKGAFTAYATPTILGELKRYFRDRGWMVRPPRWIQELQAEIRVETVARPDSRDVSDLDLARRLKTDRSRVREARAASGCYSPRSIDAPSPGSTRPMAETLTVDGDEFKLVEELASLAPACRMLSEEDRELLRLRFFEDLTQQEIADRVGISQMQVSRRLKRVLDTLREQLAPPEAA